MIKELLFHQNVCFNINAKPKKKTFMKPYFVHGFIVLSFSAINDKKKKNKQKIFIMSACSFFAAGISSINEIHYLPTLKSAKDGPFRFICCFYMFCLIKHKNEKNIKSFFFT